MRQSPSARQVPDHSFALQQLRQRLQQPGPWADRFRQLAAAIAHAGDLTCDECQDLLELCLDDAPLPSVIQQHLETCPDCQEAYDLLRVAIAPLQDDRPTPQPQSVPARRLSFLQPSSADAPWVTRLYSRLAGGPFGIAFSFNLAYLLDLFTAARPLLARGDAFPPSGQVLLLSQVVHLGEQALSVTVTADQDRAQPDFIQVEVTITSPDPLPQPLWARLTWGEQTWTTRIGPDGQARWEEIPLAALHPPGAGRFALDIEVREDAGDISLQLR